jgi:hypothetical protein
MLAIRLNSDLMMTAGRGSALSYFLAEDYIR